MTHQEERLDYYRRREAAERQRASSAGDPAISRIHSDLAECYARIVQNGEANTPETRAVLTHVVAG